ncbi:hypothetical protein ALC62_02394 [Cyphomyrmex costatus]|uniref:Uncharacterized protein n=1 Tax=Cyphomyrmex costatus TaxID=456900 RepID=A0A195D1E6_9HYME|nr:hypothetical protein ALC62_02394 [Cyphomyrmex costatus]
MTIMNLHKWPLRSFLSLLYLLCSLLRCYSFFLTSFYSLWIRLVPLVLQKDEEEVEAKAKPRGQTSVVPHRSSVLPVRTQHFSFLVSSFLKYLHYSQQLPALNIFHPLKNFEQLVYVFFLH